MDKKINTKKANKRIKDEYTKISKPKKQPPIAPKGVTKVYESG